jgi:quercetin dioxygenase-like cupin family protein
LIRKSRTYQRAVHAAELFLNSRQLDSVRGEISSSRLFCSALRSLDVFAPTKLCLGQIVSSGTTGIDHEMEAAIEALDLLIGARYFPDFPDHRIFATLMLYDQAWNRVVDSLKKISNKEVNTILGNFASALNSIVSGNGLYIVNWKHPPAQSTTLYAKVGLEISRLCCGDFVGIYKVKIKGKGRAPHHSHSLLDEHHFLPEKINGVHQLGRRAARCTDPDILYIQRGQIHSFRNDEERDRSFLFISGSPNLGPWDFVQDITTFPEIDFPGPKQIEDSLEVIGGRILLLDGKSNTSNHKQEHFVKHRLSPKSLKLTHDEIIVYSEYSPPNKQKDLHMYVAQGRGRFQVFDRVANIRKGDLFVIKSGMPAKIVPASDEKLTLYEFAI